MTVTSIMGQTRQCRYCGKLGNLNHMYYIGRVWYCCASHANLANQEKRNEKVAHLDAALDVCARPRE